MRMTTLAAGYGETILTPPLGVELAGYGFYLERRAESVLDDLKARALFLEKDGVRVVIVSCDLVGLTVEASDAARRAISASLGIPPDHVLLACTHTHTGPATMDMPGLGGADPAYVRSLSPTIVVAAERAAADAQEARLSYAQETLEPIGYNRRRKSFEEIDPVLRAVYFRRRTDRLMLLGYACHAVVLGRSRAVSADWPGAAVRAVQESGDRALVLQGFCGDIDPVTNMNRWGAGSPEDLGLLGRIVAQRARKSEAYAVVPAEMGIASFEKRIRLPLIVPPAAAIEREMAAFLEKNGGFPQADRFARAWARAAAEARDRLAAAPFIDDVPVQAIDLAGLPVLGLPGEAFSAYGALWAGTHPRLFPAGYANGDVGYFPTRCAYDDSGDYAAYGAPKFYALFPFTPEIVSILAAAGRDVLSGLARGRTY
jgi:hypothetical protein